MPGSDTENSANSGTQNLTNGGPREDQSRIRKGQIDWVTGLERSVEFRSWLFKFRVGAQTYLSKSVYPENEERRYAWLNALLRASVLGKNEEMASYLELLDHSGARCEDLLTRLEKRFLPASDVEKKRVTAQFLAFSRAKKSLWEALKEFQQLELECLKFGYDAGEATTIAKLEEMVLVEVI